MSDSVIASSVSGEVRIEAIEHKGKTAFRTYFKNDLLPKFNVNDWPAEDRSIKGICAYYVRVKKDLRAFLDGKVEDLKKILIELESDMAT